MRCIWILLLVVIILMLSAVDTKDRRRKKDRERVSSRIRQTTSRPRKGSKAGKRYRGQTFSRSNWKAGLLAGTIVGGSLYMRRRRYKSNPDKEPTICYNNKYKQNVTVDIVTFDNTTFENVTYGNGSISNVTLGYFICPMHDQDDSLEYCCGDEGEGGQVCCKFFDSPQRLAGVIVGVLTVFVLFGVGIFICCHRRQKMKGMVINKPKGQENPLLPPGTAAGSYGYPQQPPPNQGTELQQMPPLPYTADPHSQQVPPQSYTAGPDNPLLPPGNVAAPFGYPQQPPPNQGLPYPTA